MAGASVLDSNVVALLQQNYDEINAARSAAQRVSAGEYNAVFEKKQDQADDSP